MKRPGSQSIILLICLLFCGLASAQRPMIWVSDADRDLLLERIARVPEIGHYYAAFTDRVDRELESYEDKPLAYLNGFPYVSTEGLGEAIPPLQTFTSFSGPTQAARQLILLRLQTAIDAGVIYWLGGEERYGRYAADVLHNVVGGLLALQPSSNRSNGGWLYPDDHLREAREVGAQLPILYDFVHAYLKKERKVLDVGRQKRVVFDRKAAQDVFRTYVRLATESGHTGSNWSVLEMGSLLHNALALDKKEQRERALDYVLTIGTDHQDALPAIMLTYSDHGGHWPESINYSQGLASFLITFYTVLQRYDPTLDLASDHETVIGALAHAYQLTYPDGKQTVLFGDGHRPYRPQYSSYEIGYHLAERTGNDSLRGVLGALIKAGTESGEYRRFELDHRNLGATIYRDPLSLLWYSDTISTPAGTYPLPVTYELPFAGLTLQRNLSPGGDPVDALMAFVGGGAFVHGHASGMNAEFYGRGHVLGTKAGRGTYRSELHENYYRLFASHNTVVVNGASRGEGDWVNLGIERVGRTHAEPLPKHDPVSADHSFQIDTFADHRGDRAEARQERALGIVRTSDSTAYYVDVYRSRSALPEQYHDYIYHNIGDTLELSLPLKPDSQRFRSSGLLPWNNNKDFRNPGWHYFESVVSSAPTDTDVSATFSASLLDPDTLRMRAFLPGHRGRTYTSVMAPPSTESSRPYDDLPTPTLVVRQEGEAWSCPFTTVYEPYQGEGNSIASVSYLNPTRGGECDGVRVVNNARLANRSQYILSPAPENQQFTDPTSGLDFSGRYAVVSVDREGALESVYLGNGSRLSYRGTEIATIGGEAAAAFVDFTVPTVSVNSSVGLVINLPGGETIEYIPNQQ